MEKLLSTLQKQDVFLKALGIGSEAAHAAGPCIFWAVSSCGAHGSEVTFRRHSDPIRHLDLKGRVWAQAADKVSAFCRRLLGHLPAD